MSRQTPETKDAFALMRLYDAKANGVRYTTVLRLVREFGLDAAITQLEAWGLKPAVAGELAEEPEDIEVAGAPATVPEVLYRRRS